MSWDIHGQPLAAGHCEVHPGVHESYPCSICLQENRYYEQRRQEEEEMERLYWEEQEAEFQEACMDACVGLA